MLPLLILAFAAALAFFGLGEALVPMLIAFFLAYIMIPLVKRLEKRGIRREVAVACALVLTLIFWGLAGFFLIPALIKDLRSFAHALPSIAEGAIHKLDDLALRFGVELPLSKEELLEQARAALATIPLGALKSIGLIFGKALTGTVGVFLAIMNLLLIPVFFVYLIADYERLIKGAKNLVPPRHREWFDVFLIRADQIVSAYFRGQILVALLLGLFYAIGLWAVGLQFGPVLGFLTGLLCLIPFAGPLIGIGLATIVALASHGGLSGILGVWAVFVAMQALEGLVLTPKIIGDRVGLNALETMLALIIAGNLGGFAGILVAVPTAGILKVLLAECRDRYVRSSLYTAQRS